MSKIRITKHWNVPPHKDYSIGDEYSATLHTCLKHSHGECYAILENGYTIPNGCFEIIDAPTSMKITAMQQAIERISHYINDAPQQTRERGLLLAIKSEVEQFLEVEKQQIVEAWQYGAKEASDYDHLIDGATDYFNQTYKQ